MNTKKKKINRIILSIFSVFILVFSIFSLIPFNKHTNVVKADEVYNNAYFRSSPVTFTSSMYEFYHNSNDVLVSVYPSGLNSYQVATHGNYSNYFPFLYTVFTVHLRYDANGVVEFLPMFQHPEIVDGQGYVSTNGVMNLYNYTFINVLSDTLADSSYFLNGYIDNGTAYGTWISTNGSNNVSSGDTMLISMDRSSFNGGNFTQLNQHISGIAFKYYISGNFRIEKIYSVEFYSDFVKYNDIDGNYIQFQILSSNYDQYVRTYYFSNNLFTDNDYFEAGYSEGYSEGYSNGEGTGLNTGYTNGFNTGKDEGYWLGYNEALENSDTYSFTNLIAAVIDVPVNTFKSLFNFEILGVNLSGFFLGLLTCCIVLGIVRLIF